MKPELDSDKLLVLVVEDNREALVIEALSIYEKYLKNTPFQVIPATDLHEARQALRDFRPAAVVRDVLLQGEHSWSLLEELKQTPSLRSIPVLVVAVVENREKALALGAGGFYEKPVARAWLLRQLESTAECQLGPQVLIIDDDEASRDLIEAVLAQGECRVLEAAGGNEGLRACEDKPDVVVLDLATPDLSGFEVLRRLEQNPQTAAIPVIIHTSKIPDSPERSPLSSAVATISQEATSRDLSLAHFTDALAKAGFAFPARPGNEATHV
jgi:CheY-like chemotaxis protein